MKINTGKGTISLMALLAIWSISLVVNLPGLAVTPMMGSLDKIFHHASELEIQLLTVLPNIFIIPFVLLSGKLSLSKSKVKIVVVALAIYLASGICYLFANSMVSLIIISCALGIGCGLLIPLAAGLLADVFVGKYRMQQLGIKSGVSNLALVLATFVVGWLSKDSNWRLPFLVYLMPAIPLLLTPFLRNISQSSGGGTATSGDDATPAQALGPVPTEKPYHGFYMKRLWWLIGVYFFICYATMVISYYSPFLMQDQCGMNSTQVGTVTAIFFFAIFLPGFLLAPIVKILKQSTCVVSAISMGVGLILMIIGRDFWVMCAAAFLTGFGYGVLQPVIYDKTTRVVNSQKLSTLALSYVLAANYLSISLTPFIADGCKKLLGIPASDNAFPFILNAILMAAFIVIILIKRRSFVFAIEKSYYQ